MKNLGHRLTAAQLAVTAHVAGVFAALRKDDRGQASIEYAGIVIVVVLVVGAVIAAAEGIGGTLVEKITAKIGELNG